MFRLLHDLFVSIFGRWCPGCREWFRSDFCGHTVRLRELDLEIRL